MDSLPNADAQAAIEQPIIHPVWVGFLDIEGDPVRVTTAPYSVTFTGTGDDDLDGFTFDAVDHRFISVSAIVAKEGGGDTVTCTLSGLAGVDDELMTTVGRRASFQGRDARLWKMMYNFNLQRVGNIWSYFTGYMSAPKVSGDATQQTLQITVETYLAFMTQASGRTLLSQGDYDPGDHSAELSIAVANGTNTIASTANVSGGGVSGGRASNGVYL